MQTFNTSLATIKGDMNVSIRVIMRNGEAWFLAKDATDALGYAHGPSAIRDNVEEHQRSTVRLAHGTSGGNPNTIISEPGLYALIVSSKLPQAKLFKRWVFEVVLPSIRKNGGFILGQEKVLTGEMSDKELMARALKVANKVLDERDETGFNSA